MEIKENYTHEELEENIKNAMLAYREYSAACKEHSAISSKYVSGRSYKNSSICLENIVKRINEIVKKCEEHIPKSLIDEFGIKNFPE